MIKASVTLSDEGFTCALAIHPVGCACALSCLLSQCDIEQHSCVATEASSTKCYSRLHTAGLRRGESVTGWGQPSRRRQRQSGARGE